MINIDYHVAIYIIFPSACPFPGAGDSDSVLQENRITDTTAAEARRGKDIQGIPWDRLSISREKYRQTRLEQYKNYENIPQSGELSEKVSSSCLELLSI
jgi:hypothetical protein